MAGICQRIKIPTQENAVQNILGLVFWIVFMYRIVLVNIDSSLMDLLNAGAPVISSDCCRCSRNHASCSLTALSGGDAE
jgi:hypothetical protein